MPDDFQIGPLDPADEADFITLLSESLLSYDRPFWYRYLDRVGRQHARTIRAGGRCVGGLANYQMAQWFGGRPVRCAGVSGVAIGAELRGSGAARRLVAATLVESRQAGIPLASLFASTQTLYRRVGFQQAGTQTRYSLPLSSIDGGHDRSCPVHRLDPPDWELLDQVAQVRAAAGNGLLQRTAGLWQRLFQPNDGLPTTTYLFGERQAPEGYLILSANRPDQGFMQPLVATDYATTTGRALERLLSLLRDHRSIYDSFRWCGGTNDPLLLRADEFRAKIEHHQRWMLRILDVAAALEQRGYPPRLQATLDIHISDSLIPENAGNWQLHVADGRGTVTRGGCGALQLDIAALAPLYSSYLTATELAHAGLIAVHSGDPCLIAEQMFAGPAPWMPEQF